MVERGADGVASGFAADEGHESSGGGDEGCGCVIIIIVFAIYLFVNYLWG